MARAIGDEAALRAIEESRERQREAFEAAKVSRDPDKIFCAVLLVGSGNRLPFLLDLVEDLPPETFWPLFLSTWPSCDATWAHRRRLVGVLREKGDAIPYLSPPDREFFDGLPDPVRVMRGCSASRVKSVSWTTREQVAIGFAHGHRLIPVPDPVVAVADIAKDAIFAVSTERHEAEVILAPAALRIRSVTPCLLYTSPSPRDRTRSRMTSSA